MEESAVATSIMDLVLGAGLIAGLVLGIAAVVVKLTKTKRDDVILAAVRKVVDPILRALRGGKGSTKG